MGGVTVLPAYVINDNTQEVLTKFVPFLGNLKLAERGGFEPPIPLGYSRFPGVRVKPLCHLSTQAIGT
jgi:hypothetical protein